MAHRDRRVAVLRTKHVAVKHNYGAEVAKLGFDNEIPMREGMQLRPFPSSYVIPLYESNFRVSIQNNNTDQTLKPPTDLFLYQSKIYDLSINTETLNLLTNLAKFSNETYITASREWLRLLSKLIPLCNKKSKGKSDDPLQNIQQTSLIFSELEIRILPIVYLSHYKIENDDIASVCVSVGASSMLLSPLSDSDRDVAMKRNRNGNSSPSLSSRSGSPVSMSSSRSVSPTSRGRIRVENEAIEEGEEEVDDINETEPSGLEGADDDIMPSEDDNNDEDDDSDEEESEGEVEDNEEDDVIHHKNTGGDSIDEKHSGDNGGSSTEVHTQLTSEVNKNVIGTDGHLIIAHESDKASLPEVSTLRLDISELRESALSDTPSNYTVKIPGASLIQNLQEERRITMRNILRWTIQLFSTVHSLHMKFTTLNGDVCIEDVMLLSDPMMMSSMKECHSKYLRDTGKAIRLQGAVRQSAIDDETKEVLIVRRFSKERDAWIDPSRWLKSKITPFRGYSNPLITKFNLNKSSIILADRKNVGFFSIPPKLEAEKKQLLFDLNLFHHAVRKDLRAIGFIIVQMLLKEHILPWDSLKTKLRSDSCGYEDIINLLPMQLLYKECPELVGVLQLCYSNDAMYAPCEVPAKAKLANIQLKVEILCVCDNLLLTLKEVQAKKEKNLHWKKRSKWTRKDERERIKKIQDRKQELVDKAATAVDTALKRISEQQELKNFYLQPPHVQKKLLAKKEARIKAEANRKARIRYLHQAAWYRWGQEEAEGWLEKAISALLLHALDMKEGPKGKFHEADIYDPAIHSRKGNTKETIKFVEMALSALNPPHLQQILKSYNYKSYVDMNSKKGAAIGDIWHDYELLIKVISKLAAHGISLACENKVLGAILDTAQVEVITKVGGSAILSMLPPDQLKAKMVQMEADYLLKSVAGGAIRGVYKDIEKRCNILESSDFTRRMAYMTAVAILEKFKACAGLREVGEAIAASLLAAIYRQNKVRRMIKAVWIRAQSEYQKQKMEEQEARRLRILSGNPLPEDLLDSAEVVTDTGAMQKFETLDAPKYLSIESTEGTTISVIVGINLGTTRYGSGFKEENHYITAHGLLLRTPLKLPDASCELETDEITMILPSNSLSNTTSSTSASATSHGKHHSMANDGLTEDEAGEILVLLRDNRQVSRYSDELQHWYYQACMKGSISLISGGEKRIVDNQTVPANTHYPRICKEYIHVSVEYIGKQPITDKWTREGFAKKKALEALGEEYTTDVDRLKVTIRNVLPYSKYRVAVLLSDIFKPVQKWDRNLNYRYDYNNPPKYFPITNQVAFALPDVMTVGNASEPPEFKAIEVTYSDHSVEYRESNLRESDDANNRNSRDCTLDNGVITELKIEVGASTDLRAVDIFCRLEWSRPYNNGKWINSYELQRQLIAVIMNNNAAHALGAKEYAYVKNMPIDIVQQRMKKMDLSAVSAVKAPISVKRIGIDPVSGISISTWKKCKTVKANHNNSSILQYVDLIHFPGDLHGLVNEYYHHLYMAKNAPFVYNAGSGDDIAAIFVNYRVRAINGYGKSQFNIQPLMHRLGIIRLLKHKIKNENSITIDTTHVLGNSHLVTINRNDTGAGNHMVSPSLYGLVQSSVRLNQQSKSDISSLDVVLSGEQMKRLNRLTNTLLGEKPGSTKGSRIISSAEQLKRRCNETYGTACVSSNTVDLLLQPPISSLGSDNAIATKADTTPSRLWDGKAVKHKRSNVDPVMSIPADLLVCIPTEQLCASDMPTSNEAWWKRSDAETKSDVEDDNVTSWLARLSFVSPMNTKNS